MTAGITVSMTHMAAIALNAGAAVTMTRTSTNVLMM